MKIRLDQLLVQKNIVASRSKASELIKSGKIKVNGNIVTKTSSSFLENVLIELDSDEILYVGRGAHKIEGAHKDFNLSFENKVVADIGACTGGFTDYALLNGASKSYAIDVGHHQLDKKLINDPRVINLEGTNIRDLESLDELVDIAVIDLSHISQMLTIKNCSHLVKTGGEIISLFKPQFEVGMGNLGKGGIVKDLELTTQKKIEFINYCETLNLEFIQEVKCAITGKKGNQEYFLYFKKKGEP